MRPIIGISTFSLEHENKPHSVLAQDYTVRVTLAGGLPWLIPMHLDAAIIVDIIDHIDGLILTGGCDVHPQYYGQSPHATVTDIDRSRDLGELALLQVALERHLPVLGICRGHQLINVYQGGTLHQHLPEVLADATLHRTPPKLSHAHSVTLETGTLLQQIFATDELKAISWHHQAIDRLGDELIVSARAADGLIEAIEMPSYSGWLVGVQWHPEAQRQQFPEQQVLFDSLIQAAGVVTHSRP